MAYISISQLSALPDNDINNNDLLLISRIQTLGENLAPAVSYKLNALEFKKGISSDVTNYLVDRWLISTENRYNILTSDIILSTTNAISTMANLSSDLTSEWHDLSTTLTADYNNLRNEWENLSVQILSDYIEFKDEVNTSALAAIEWLRNYTMEWLEQYSELSTAIKDWVSVNFVTLATDQTIVGQKTFIQEISGTALSAKWI